MPRDYWVRELFSKSSTQGVDEHSVDPNIDRRREPRVQANEPVRVTLLGHPGGPSISCTALDISGSGLSIRSPRPLPGGAAVKVEGANLLLLGDVMWWRPMEEEFHIGIKICHALALRDEFYTGQCLSSA
jgi:hypothetical protein